MFKGMTRIAVMPFFGISEQGDEDEDTLAKGGKEEKEEWKVGTEKYGWRMIGEESTRGDW